MRISRSRLSFSFAASRVALSWILSFLMAVGPDWGTAAAQPAAMPRPLTQPSEALAATVPITLTAYTLPSQGNAGNSVIYVTGTGYPTGTIPPANVTASFATTCGGSSAASTTASAVQIAYGTTRRAQVLIPATLTANTYFVSISGSTLSGTPFASANCSKVQVTSGTAKPAVLSITKTHTGSFTQGQQGASYTLTVSNAAGAGPTTGAVTVTDEVPSGLTLVSLAGTGWSCKGNACTRSDVLNGGTRHPAITATVNVASNASSPQVNVGMVSGGGSASASASDSTAITANRAALSIAKTHTESFTQGQQGASYTLTVSNAAGAAPTSGTVTVTDRVPPGLTLVSLAGTGWSCKGNACTRSDLLNRGTRYPAITATVNVASNASSPQVNVGTVSGGGSASASASDSTVIGITPPSLVFIMQPPLQVQTGQLLLPGPQVAVKDASGAVVTRYNGPVTISIGNNPGGAILSGTLTQDAVSGVATFPDLSLNAAANGYTLVASVADQSATSARFNVRVSPELASCLPSSSLGVLLPAKGTGSVTAYAPNGSWSDGHMGIQVVPIEGGGTPAVISTPNPVNSCASNSVTGETVCVANNTDVYLISGSTLNRTLTSGSSGVTVQFDPAVVTGGRPPKAPFLSGGWCLNCGVAINGVTNTAVIEMGLTSGLPPFYSGLQFLDLTTNTFSAPFPLANDISEDIQWDSIHNVILSPSEYQPGDVGPGVGFNGLPGGNYDLIDTSSSTPTEFGRLLANANFDSAAGDCTTGIALAGLEGDVPPPFQSPASRGLFISDLTQATFTVGSPGSWTAPGQFVAFPEFFYIGFLGAGTPAVAVPPGSHLAVVAGEAAGDQFGVVELPSTSGSGTPGFGDYAAAELPRTPDGQSWSQGFDPHTITAYVSPNTGRPMAIFANSAPPTWLAVIDLQGLLNAPRKAGVFPGNISTACPNCTHTVDPGYDLIGNGVVRYIGTPPQIASACPTTGQRGQQHQSVQLRGNHTHWTQDTTAVNFGPGITVESLSVADLTDARAVISIDATADLGPRTVTTATGGEIATVDNPYMITALGSVSPSTGQQGQQKLSVTLTGQFTNWVKGEPNGGVTQASFGAGITVISLTVNSPTSMTAVLNVDPSAPTGPRPVTITNLVSGCDTQTFTSAFTVTAGAFILESVIPNYGQKGQQNLSVALTGSGTNWVQGTTTASFGPEITVTSLTVNSPTNATAVLNISANAADGPQTVTITTGSEVETLANGFVVTSTVNPLMLIEPNTGQQGQQNLSVLIADTFGTTHWIPGLTTVSFGPGITVTSLTVSSQAEATAVLNISPSAATGPRTITLTTGSEVDALSNGFTVTPGTSGVPGPPAQLAFIAQPTNTMAGQPISAVLVAVEDASGNVIPTAKNSVTISVGPNSAAGTLVGTTLQLPVNGVATFGDLAISKAGGYTLVASSVGLAPATSSPFAITPGPRSQLAFTSLPSVVAPRQSMSVTVAVEDSLGNAVPSATNPVTLSLGKNPGGATLSGTTTATASAGIAVFNVSIDKAGVGYTLVASSPGLPTATSPAFTVSVGAPSQLVFLTQPNNVSSNATLNPLQVAIEDASSNVVVTAGGMVNIALYQNPSGGTLSGSLTAPIVNGIATFSGLSIGKPGSGYALEASLVPCCFAISSSFNVVPSGPTIVSLSPSAALQGASLQIAITALNTHFVQGQSTANFGPGVSVGGGLSGAFGAVQVTSDTTAIAQVSVPSNAALGLRTVAVRTGSEEASLVNGFGVNGAPFLSYVSPSSGQRGQTLNVTIKGDFTNFQPGTTQASFGSGISVGFGPEGGFGPLLVTDAVTATATLTINAAATPGLRPVAVQTAADHAALQGGGFLVLSRVTGPPPVVSINSPTEGAEITSPTVVTGTVTSPNLANWTLDYQGSDSTIFTTFATGTSATVRGTFDPTLLLNGLAVIRLTAVDQSGQTASTALNVAVARKLKVGVFTLSFNDLTIPVAGIPIQVTRTYDSRFKAVGDFGFGWTLSIKSLKVSVNGRLGNNWQGTTQGSPFLPVYCITPAQNHVVTIRLPGDQLYQFQPVLPAGQVDLTGHTKNGCQFLPLQTVDVNFVPIGATPANATLTAVNGTALFVNGTFPGIGDTPADIQLVDDVTGESFDPDQFQLTLPTGQTFLVSRTFGVQSVTDTNKNTLTITNAGITSSTGKGIAFARDNLNRITSITDPNGNVLNYVYDENGDLATFTDQLNNVSTFTYDSFHDLLSYTDPRGIQPLRNVYDDSGRLIQQIDASGNVRNFNHLTATNTEAWTDFLGNTTTYLYDSHGNIIQETDPLGNATTRTFDANDNLLSETNALGQTTSYTYDSANNQLTLTDPLGHITKSTYNSLNKPLTITDPNGHAQTYTYDASGNLLTMSDASGNTTKRAYDSSGLQISLTDQLGHSTNYGYDGVGNLASVTDPAGTVTAYTYDFNGNRTSQSITRTTPSGPQTLNTQFVFDAGNNLVNATLPDGSTVQRSYDPTGKVSSTTDELGRTTSYEYDSQGHLTRASYPDGSQGVSTYDANGNRTQFSGPSGTTISFLYDALGRVTTATNSAGGSTNTVYDAVGRTISVADPRGNVTQYAYDAAGRRTSITNALHQVTSFAFDAAGNQVSGVDANGHRTTIQHDSDNRVVKITYPDGTFDQRVYDAAGQVVAKTDPAGNSTLYSFDSAGKLVSVTDALGHLTKFAYDEVGNRISQTDANGHTTTFLYDQRGRRIRRTLPAGQTESFEYDLAGNLVSHTDFNGKTTMYLYDSDNRVLSKIPDPSFNAPAVTFTYTASGKRASMADVSGTSTYRYDSADRLIQVVKPNGTLSYTYDAAGNLISFDGGGTQVSYTYDALTRLVGVAESNTGTTSYTYDGVGNLASVTYSNGLRSNYSYNSKNGLTNLSIGKGGSNLAGYTYMLDATGHRLTVAELNGRMVHYTYDRTYRLTSESITGASAGANGSVSYTYDAVGNRAQTRSTLTGVPSGTFTYDADDRLSSDTYDADGNTISSKGTANTYDFENRLIQHGGVTLVYDGDGNRVAKTVGGVTTKYLVDDFSLTGFPQVIAERSSDGTSRILVYGLERISQRLVLPSSTVTSFYTYDGHGSVRALTDPTGAVTDTYDYDAFGNLINSSGSTPNEFLFAGEQYDSDLGLYYNRARYFDPTSGRFWTMDAVEGNARSPASLHRYLYASQDPINRIDPSGNQTLEEVMADVAIQSILSEAANFVLTSPLGQGALGIVANGLLPPGFFDTLANSLIPSAVLVGGAANFNISRGVGIEPEVGLEVLLSPRRWGCAGSAKFIPCFAVYDAGSVGITFGQGKGFEAGLSLYAGLVWHVPTSDKYGEPAINISVATNFVPTKVIIKVNNDWGPIVSGLMRHLTITSYHDIAQMVANMTSAAITVPGGASKYLNFFYEFATGATGATFSLSLHTVVRGKLAFSIANQLAPDEEVPFE